MQRQGREVKGKEIKSEVRAGNEWVGSESIPGPVMGSLLICIFAFS